MNQSGQQHCERSELRLAELEKHIAALRARNGRVEADKAWETSLTRVITITVLTWCVVSFVFWMNGVERFFFNALIPALGYYLSTQSLPFIKLLWLRRRQRLASGEQAGNSL